MYEEKKKREVPFDQALQLFSRFHICEKSYAIAWESGYEINLFIKKKPIIGTETNVVFENFLLMIYISLYQMQEKNSIINLCLQTTYFLLYIG